MSVPLLAEGQYPGTEVRISTALDPPRGETIGFGRELRFQLATVQTRGVSGVTSVALPAEARPRTRTIELGSLVVLGVVAAASTTAYLVHSPVLVRPGSTAVVRGLYVAAYVAAGAYTWSRRPSSRSGPMIALAGLVFALTSLNGAADPVAHSVGMTVQAALLVYLSYVYLSFPRSRIGVPSERRAVLGFGCFVGLVWTAILVLVDRLPNVSVFADCGDRCPRNGLQLVDTATLLQAGLRGLYTTGSAAIAVAVAVLIVRKTRSPGRLRRRALEPLGVAYVAAIIAFVLYLLIEPALPGTAPTLRAIAAAAQLAIPAAMVLGQVRGRIFAATKVGQLVVSMGGRSVTPEDLEELIRNTLGDPTLTLAFPTSDENVFVDVRGAAVGTLPETRILTPVVLAGQTVAAFVHDAALDADPSVVEGVAASSLMLLENAKLVEELRASRTRLVTVADDERLRLERDLHDGAQQRLMALQIKLALLRDRIDSDELAAAVDEIEEDASAAVEELRGLAHGIYPTVLRERGLDDGIESIARAAALPVRREGASVGRLSPAVEAAVYFCINEAVQNATKHAGPGAHIVISLRRAVDDSLEFVVRDDGAGFDAALAADGIGLVSMRDRIGGVGGEVEVVSRAGHGTEVRGTVPRALRLDVELDARGGG